MWKSKDLIDFRKLVKYKDSDIGIFLGCGDSINDITSEQWDIISNCDTWVSNNFLYHWFVPDFYHLELKSREKGWQKLWRRRKQEKGDTYNNVKFVVNGGHNDHLLPQIGDHPQVFGYPRKVIKNNARAINYDKFATHSQNASFTLVLDLMSKMKYEKVVLFGVDLKRSTYFWTDRPEFGETHCETNKGLPPKEPHTTAGRVSKFIILVGRKWFNNQLYVGYEDTLLYDMNMKYIDIEKL
jgi:hypothetical protein